MRPGQFYPTLPHNHTNVINVKICQCACVCLLLLYVETAKRIWLKLEIYIAYYLPEITHKLLFTPTFPRDRDIRRGNREAQLVAYKGLSTRDGIIIYRTRRERDVHRL